MKKTSIGSNIKQMRIYNGMTQDDLAKRLEISRQTISSWEINRTEPSINDIEKLAAVFGCKKSVLLREDKDISDEEKLIEQYLQDEKIRALVLYAGGIMPKEERDKYIEAIMQALTVMKK